MNPQTLRYTKEHEWIALEGTTATVGITAHAQDALGDITYVDIPAVGKKLAAGDSLGVIESVKAASDIFAPVAGVIAAVNEALVDTPELINDEPYGTGWICKLRDVDPAAVTALLSAAQYEEFLKEEA